MWSWWIIVNESISILPALSCWYYLCHHLDPFSIRSMRTPCQQACSENHSWLQLRQVNNIAGGEFLFCIWIVSWTSTEKSLFHTLALGWTYNFYFPTLKKKSLLCCWVCFSCLTEVFLWCATILPLDAVCYAFVSFVLMWWFHNSCKHNKVYEFIFSTEHVCSQLK